MVVKHVPSGKEAPRGAVPSVASAGPESSGNGNGNGKAPGSGSRRSSFRTTVMANITVHVKAQPDFAGTLVDISESGCRLRAAFSLNIGTELSFEWSRFGKPPLRLVGRVMTRRRTQARTLYDYGIAFATVSEATKDAIISETMELQRREALRNAPTESSIAQQVADKLGTKRSAYRAKVTFEVSYLLPGRPGKRNATASDLSLGGLRLTTDEKLPEGTVIDFQFRLPNKVLVIYENERQEIEHSPFGERVVTKRAVIRPFEEMRLRGRVVKVLRELPKVELGIAFLDPHPFAVSELSRFIHAVQLAKLRSERGY